MNLSDLSDIRSLKKKTLIESVKNGVTIVSACQKADITRATFYDWCIEDKEFGQAIEDAKRGRVNVIEDALFHKAKSGSVVAQIFFLKNKAGWKDNPLFNFVGSIHQNKTNITFVGIEPDGDKTPKEGSPSIGIEQAL